jgi:BirA family biotin operon repressor/biotin-[acetyl-CoA-carboxylase] ligase
MQGIYISAKPKEGRRPGRYELIWEIPINSSGMDDILDYLEKNLTTGFVGRKLFYLAVTSSTQDVAREMADQGAPEGAAVIAGMQQSGRGRLGRSWLSPEGGLATSIILRPDMSDLPLLPAITALAVFRTIRALGIEAGIKWPNDILIGGRKVCGILIEHGLNEGVIRYSIVGIGININFDTAQYPEIAGFATSLSVELGHELPVGQVALRLYRELEVMYLRRREPDSILTEWAANMITIGKQVKVKLANGDIEGIAEGINRSGYLLLRKDDGSLQEIMAGDVSLITDQSKK